MTKVTFYQKSSGEITGFEVSGHAGYADEGEDIVCSAISALVFNTINSIDELTDDNFRLDMDQEKAYTKVSFDKLPGEKAELLLRSLALGLTNIEEDEAAGNFIDVIFEED